MTQFERDYLLWEAWATEILGVRGFRWFREAQDRKWLILMNREDTSALPDHVAHFHGTTLHQCQLILRDGFFVGKYHRGSPSFPSGIWGTNMPGHAFDRTPLKRGWSFPQSGVEAKVSGWDCPVALRCMFHRDQLTRRKDVGLLGMKSVYQLPAGSVYDMVGRPLEVWIDRELFLRFRSVADEWDAVTRGRSVLCRARRRHPADVWNAGCAAPMTCCRVVDINSLEFQSWIRTNKTHQYVCPTCTFNYRRGSPCTA